MESHGQIRHGKEFQSDIPANKINNRIGIILFNFRIKQMVVIEEKKAIKKIDRRTDILKI